MRRVKIDGYMVFAQNVMKQTVVLRQVTTNVLTHVTGGTVEAGKRGLVLGLILSNWNATACTVTLTEGATVAMGPFYILGNDLLQFPAGGLSYLPVGAFAQGKDIRARVSTPGTNVAINIYYYAQSVT